MFYRHLIRYIVAALLAMLACIAYADDQAMKKVRVGVLEFGSVNWELDVMQAHGLTRKHGIELVEVRLASGDASTIALQGGAVDIIVSDWIWVSRQRAEAKPYAFVPFSNAVGSLMVKNSSPYQNLVDLKDKKLGIAGGPNDKTWVLLRAYAQRQFNTDLAKLVKPTFAAPPLLNELALRDQVDGALNYWHYAARLEANGMRPLITMPQILSGLGIDRPIPLIGWIFRDDWAANNRDTVKGFLAASYEAKTLLANSDDEWTRLRPKMRAESEGIFKALVKGFREGIPACSDRQTMDAVSKTFQVLAEVGGKQLVGNSTQLTPGTFWPNFQLPEC
ncbi:ABC transporter substrate-binding protein [Noviherbaspirillum sp. Root189]|nr:ABC transporter substrate-binding protein [Noviherbaspirillum sp. Root189]